MQKNISKICIFHIFALPLHRLNKKVKKHTIYNNNQNLTIMTTTIKQNLQQIADSVCLFKDNLNNEETTKQALILPFISQALGYNVFSPFEVQAEYTCDILKTKGEKVDYAIMQDNKPTIIIECKKFNETLTLHTAQLARYFAATNAKFAVLTNGTIYQFYTDTEQQNLMDNTPFFTFDILNMTEQNYNILEQFHKTQFNQLSIYNTANSLKTFTQLKNTLKDALNTPSPELVKLVAKNCYNGRFSDSVLNTYTHTFNKAWQAIKNDIINDTLKVIIKQNDNDNDNPTEDNTPKKEIITTDNEIEAYHYIKAIAQPIMDTNRIVLKDGLNACNICIDNQRKSICHLLFNNENKLKLEIDGNQFPIDNPIDTLNFKQQITDKINSLL